MGGDDLTGSSLSDAEKVRIASDFIKHAPPGEFNEVFNSLRMLLSDDRLLSNGCASAFADYNRDQFAPVRVDGAEKQTLITRFNDLGGGRFADPVEKNSFHYDHLGKTANDVAPLPELDSNTERWRHALQHELEAYIDAHYQKAGVGVVFVQGNTITIAIESHQFQPKNYWNGRWRATWTIPVGDGKSGFQELKGNIKVQVHYYEDGNVQLFSDHEITAKVQVTADYEKTAKDVLDVISAEETKYQAAVQENYATMSETTFKALRRQLPVTRAKMDWAKLPTYRVAQDLRPQ